MSVVKSQTKKKIKKENEELVTTETQGARQEGKDSLVTDITYQPTVLASDCSRETAAPGHRWDADGRHISSHTLRATGGNRRDTQPKAP